MVQPLMRKVSVSLILFTSACMAGGDADVAGEPGEPLRDLTEEQLGRFLLGKAVFERLTTPEEGLGPLYNETRCSSCHDVPASGGFGVELVVKATRFENGVCDLLVSEGGDNIQQRATPLLIARGITREANPPSATARVRVEGPSLFGLGLVQAIPAETLLGREDPNDSDGDGISGRAGRTSDGRLGRFGRKAEHATIFDFVESALRFELGLTTPMNPAEETVNGVPVPAEADPIADPEIDESGISLLSDFVRYLAPPARAIAMSQATRDSIQRGEQLFGEVGCTSCHVPSMLSGPSDIDALDRKTVNLYSDMLLHDMGPALADVCGEHASPSEYRTARLWGLQYRDSFLHDGRAASPREAVLTHDGEAAGARTLFAMLSPAQQAFLLRFLASL